jgi:hypothetical protein
LLAQLSRSNLKRLETLKRVFSAFPSIDRSIDRSNLKRHAGNEKKRVDGWVGRSLAVDVHRRTVSLLVLRRTENEGTLCSVLHVRDDKLLAAFSKECRVSAIRWLFSWSVAFSLCYVTHWNKERKDERDGNEDIRKP